MSDTIQKPKIYIDGQAGTTGLNLMDRLMQRDDVELLRIEDENRHNTKRRQELMKQADLVFLCLPDEASIEASRWIEPETRVIDTSTAHRTLWEYGLPDLDSSFREKVIHSRRISNPGCHATGVISLLYPLIQGGLVKKDQPLSCFSLTGYSGGGKKMIEEYETNAGSPEFSSPKAYSLGLVHKHLKEIQKICRLKEAPAFLPVVDDYFSGMAVFIPLHVKDLQKKMSRQEILDFYEDWYKDSSTIHVCRDNISSLRAGDLSGFDDLNLYALGNDDHMYLCALFDNLGKGACGAAIQNMNLVLGFPEDKGLRLQKKENFHES